MQVALGGKRFKTVWQIHLTNFETVENRTVDFMFTNPSIFSCVAVSGFPRPPAQNPNCRTEGAPSLSREQQPRNRTQLRDPRPESSPLLLSP